MHAHAMDHLRYIRETMEGAASFTAVPGFGGIAMGATALFAALVAAVQPTLDRWLAVWVAEGFLAMVIGVVAMAHKARSVNVSLFSRPGQKFALGLSPPMLAAALLTAIAAFGMPVDMALRTAGLGAAYVDNASGFSHIVFDETVPAVNP